MFSESNTDQPPIISSWMNATPVDKQTVLINNPNYVLVHKFFKIYDSFKPIMRWKFAESLKHYGLFNGCFYTEKNCPATDETTMFDPFSEYPIDPINLRLNELYFISSVDMYPEFRDILQQVVETYWNL